MEIPAELESRIDEVITHYPVSKRSATMPLLYLVQEYFGFIEDQAIEWIARKLELEPSRLTLHPNRRPSLQRAAQRSVP